jgi:hypothetical protein
MKKFDAVVYMLPVPNGEFENIVNPTTTAIIHRQPKYDHAPVYAIVLDIHEQTDEEAIVDLAFLHPSRVSALAGADWREAFERVFGVRHASHDEVEGNLAMGHYAELPTRESFERFAAFKNDQLQGAHEQIDKLKAELSKPSAADLDAVAAEQQAKEQTS